MASDGTNTFPGNLKFTSVSDTYWKKYNGSRKNNKGWCIFHQNSRGSFYIPMNKKSITIAGALSWVCGHGYVSF